MRRSLALPVLIAISTAVMGCESPGSPPDAGPSSTGPSASASSPVSLPSAAVSPSVAPAKPAISNAALSYFLIVALETEFGEARDYVVRWAKPEVTVRVNGAANARSRSCLDRVISDFNALTAITDLKLTTGPADIEMHFAPVSKFPSLLKSYRSGNDGYFSIRWSGTKVITGGTVLIRSTGISERIRCHLIREELTQSMGMLQDSRRYRDSIFQADYASAPVSYSAIDQEVIRLLYSGAVQPGDRKQAVKAAVTTK